jgi:hypothetical protein
VRAIQWVRQVREGLYYNPYFPGGAIAMPKMLVDGGAEYDDGTPASASQQAKDIVTFLTWSCYPLQVQGIAVAGIWVQNEKARKRLAKDWIGFGSVLAYGHLVGMRSSHGCRLMDCYQRVCSKLLLASLVHYRFQTCQSQKFSSVKGKSLP